MRTAPLEPQPAPAAAPPSFPAAELPLEVLRCPLHADAGPLHLAAGLAGSPGLVCPHCRHTYPVVGGIVDLLPPGLTPGSFQEREMSQWDGQAPAYEAVRQDDELYQAGVGAAARALRPRPGDWVLDAGCGTGLPTRRYLRPGLRLVCLDLSLESLRRLQAALPPGAACFVRADLAALPLAAAAFDRVLCANALQHVPSPRLRQECVGELARVARPGARVVVTAHNYSRKKRKAGWSKEGDVRSGSGPVQYIHRFEAAEFRALLASRLRVESVRGAGLPLPYRLKLSWLSRRLERLWSKFDCSADWGNMLVGVGWREGG